MKRYLDSDEDAVAAGLNSDVLASFVVCAPFISLVVPGNNSITNLLIELP